MPENDHATVTQNMQAVRHRADRQVAITGVPVRPGLSRQRVGWRQRLVTPGGDHFPLLFLLFVHFGNGGEETSVPVRRRQPHQAVVNAIAKDIGKTIRIAVDENHQANRLFRNKRNISAKPVEVPDTVDRLISPVRFDEPTEAVSAQTDFRMNSRHKWLVSDLRPVDFRYFPSFHLSPALKEEKRI